MILVTLAGMLAGCQSSRTPSASAPTPAPRPTPTPTPAPEIPEEVVSEPVTTSVPSVEVTEELPEDLLLLNERGYLEDVFFETDRYDLTPEAREKLAENSSWLQKYPSVKILVEGHCDERNTREYNLALGERRAAAVRDYLVFLGTTPERIQTISYGEERPFAQGSTEEAWQLNRRAHFVIIAR
jgi:peptidoglycan-associated lipoprotein